ncbi:MFS-type transporter SLC18B1 [Microtus ochrogaster]|uniref:MFS-type transporter SLC18B1 n=1 Tax=Microtus ochrogaster TaxID=79684 RepID=A0A8J6L5U1_MICOH|nr:MFS-type transporter SLC18B1 [Microtus ochrogaster]
MGGDPSSAPHPPSRSLVPCSRDLEGFLQPALISATGPGMRSPGPVERPLPAHPAEKKGASNTMIGAIFGCYALFELLASLVFGKYLVQIGAKFMFIAGMFISGGVTILFGVLDQLPEGPIFIVMCFLVRIVDAIGFGAAITASSSILAKAFPNNVATVLGSLEVFSGLGLIVGPPLGGFLYQSFGYEMPFILLGCLVLLMIPLNLCILPSYESDRGEHSFWKLVTLPKVGLIACVIIALSSCFGFLDPILSLFVLEKFNLPAGYVGLVFLGLALSYTISSPLFGLLSDRMPNLRKWFLVFGNLITAVCYMLLGPVPILHIKSQLWLLVLVLVVNGFSAGMSIIPTLPEMLSCAYENGFEEGISTLGLVSGLVGAMWSVGAFMGPMLGGFLYEKIGFEWAAAVQGLWALISMEFRLYSVTGQMEPQLYSITGQMEPQLYSVTGQMEPRLYSVTGQMEPQLYSITGQMEP